MDWSKLNAACRETFGDDCVFHDPTGSVADTDLRLVFSERDIAEPPGGMGTTRGKYSTAWADATTLPVTDPTGYQIVENGIAYWIREATNDGGGGITMKLHRVRL